MKAAFLTLEFPVFVKSTVKWNGYEACYTSLLHVFVTCVTCVYFFGLDSAQCLHVINSIPIILILQTNKNVRAIFSVTIIL